MNAAARELGLERKEVQRAVKIAKIRKACGFASIHCGRCVRLQIQKGFGFGCQCFVRTRRPIDTGRGRARADAALIKGLMRRTGEDIVEIGKALLRQKNTLPHGMFLSWIDAEFGMHERTAQRFMGVAETFKGKYDTVSHLPPAALYELAAPSTPEEVRAEIERRVAAGELDENLAESFLAVGWLWPRRHDHEKQGAPVVYVTGSGTASLMKPPLARCVDSKIVQELPDPRSLAPVS
jgi:hypothetical protein